MGILARMGRILFRYLFLEILVPFLFGLAVFTSVLLIARILKLVEMVVNRGVPFLDILTLFSLILPAFLEVTIPMALLLAILVGFGRLSADSEVVAMKTSGLSLYQFLLPVAAFATITFLLTFATSLWVRPWANGALKNQLFQVARSRATAAFKEKIFNDDFPGVVLYIEEIEPGGETLKGVLIADTRDPDERRTVFAKVGLILPTENDAITLRLLDGTIYGRSPEGERFQWTNFNVYDVSFKLNALTDLGSRERKEQELTLGELRDRIEAKEGRGEPAYGERIEYHRKFSIPFACVVFTLVGMPLGIQSSRSVRSRGFSVSLVLIFGYYVLLTVGQSLAEKGRIPAVVGLWAPNAAFLALGLAMFHKAAREAPIHTLDRLAELRRRVQAWILRRMEARESA